MNEGAIIIRDDARLAVTFSAEALALKNKALESGALVGRVSNAEEQEAAVAAQKDLRSVQLTAEKARKACKEPVLEFGKRIDAAAKAFCRELDVEMVRISTLVNDFQQLEAMKQREAEKARLAEISQLEREKAEALSKATSHEQADAINEHFANRAAVEAPPPPPPTRVAGQQVRTDWEIVVTNPWELAKYHPDCVKIEPLLTPIKAALNEGRTVKGIRAEKKTIAGVRLAPQRAAIDV